jgi:DNA-directed RNA polymerase subunit RPC12/RpoP
MSEPDNRYKCPRCGAKKFHIFEDGRIECIYCERKIGMVEFERGKV